MRKLFLYYSLSGNGDLLASIMQNYGYEAVKIQPKKSMPKRFFSQILLGGMLAMLNRKTPLETALPDAALYDEIVVGAPVWNARLATPVNTAIAELNHPFTLLCYSGSGKAQKVAKQLKKLPVQKIIVLRQPLDNRKECESVLKKEFVEIA